MLPAEKRRRERRKLFGATSEERPPITKKTVGRVFGPPPMPTYSIDSLYPHRFRFDLCGHHDMAIGHAIGDLEGSFGKTSKRTLYVPVAPGL
jgi:hypothetical protein